MRTKNGTLEQKIGAAVEQLVREHLAACEAAATTAVSEAFRRASRTGTTGPRGGKRPRGRTSGRRRTRQEVAELEERLYEAICAQPGETMSVLAPVVGASARDLNRPAKVLRQQDRVRSIGERNATRYFPLGT